MSDSRRDMAVLDTLAIALDPPDLAPSAEGLFRLRMAVAEHHRLVGVTRPVRTTGWWRRLFRRASRAPRP